VRDTSYINYKSDNCCICYISYKSDIRYIHDISCINDIHINDIRYFNSFISNIGDNIYIYICDINYVS
jgi:hypothetical protein